MLTKGPQKIPLLSPNSPPSLSSRSMFKLGPNTRLEPLELPAGWLSTALSFHCSSSHSHPGGATRLRIASTNMKPKAVENPALTEFVQFEL